MDQKYFEVNLASPALYISTLNSQKIALAYSSEDGNKICEKSDK